MAPSFDYAVSSLLCAEDNNSVFDDIDCFGNEFEGTLIHRNHRNSNQNRGFDDANPNPIPLQREECLVLMVEKENQHMPHPDYMNRLQSGDLEVGARREAVDWIWKVHAHFGFGPLSAYLSINYLDRFLSFYELPKGKTWMMQLLAVACLSLAAKMEETEVPLSLDLQVGESKYVFEAKTIQKMELLVLSTLNWRMQSITPFSFIDYFLYNVNDDQFQHKTSIMRSTQLILNLTKGIDFLEFKPSEIAAAVAISVARETKKTDSEKTISPLITNLVQKEKVFKCMELVKGVVGGAAIGVVSVPQSPIGVLDAACLSYKTDEGIVGSCPSSAHNTPETKRRRLNKTCEVEGWK